MDCSTRVSRIRAAPSRASSLTPRRRFSPALRALHAELNTLRQTASELESSLQDKFEIPKLTLRINSKFGPVIHVHAKGQALKHIEADESLAQVIKSQSTRSYSMAASHG